MFFTGLMRTATAFRNYGKLWLYSMFKSTHWGIELSRWAELKPWNLIITMWNTYFHVNDLWRSGMYKEAGEFMVLELFPEKLPDADSPIDWWFLPNIVWWDGQEIGEEIAGLIYRFLGEENFDNLASCVQYQDYFLKNLRASVETFQGRTNDDVVHGLGQMAAIF